jgi:hypothetical protein
VTARIRCLGDPGESDLVEDVAMPELGEGVEDRRSAGAIAEIGVGEVAVEVDVGRLNVGLAMIRIQACMPPSSR